ncbi:MAG TPA: TonB-dependent receptor [Terriglobales bacterium]|nr:TonB-dependent receptor [Terriglobales bacterium]
MIALLALSSPLAGSLAGQSQASPSGQISGVVSDQTGAAVQSATVIFSRGSFTATQVTDASGKFVFSGITAEAGVVRTSAAGFQTSDTDWRSGSGPLEIVLRPASAAEQVTVTANRTGVRLVENATSVVVLSGPDLDATAAFRLDDMLRQVPGFSLFRRTTSRTANPTTQGVSLRGLGASGASRALVLSDGFPLNDPFGGWVYWDRAPRESIQSVEVASGGASHLYGSDALGGVINIIRTPPDRNSVSLEAAYGNENSPDLSLSASRKMGPWSVGVASELFRSDGYIAVPESLRGAIDTLVNSQDATGDVTVRREFADRGDFFVRGSVFGESRHNGTPLQTNSTTIRELDFGGNWDAREFGAFQLRAYAGRQNLDQSFSSIASDRNSENLTRTQRVPAQQVGFSVQWQRTVGTRQHLVAGVEESNIHGQTNEQGYFNGLPTSTSAGGGREVNWGAYAEDIIRIAPDWLLTASGRVDHWLNFDAFAPPNPAVPVGAASLPDRSESFFSPRLAILHKLTSNISLTASGYRSFRAPTLNELYRGFRAGNVFTEANSNLRAERLTGAEGGAIATGWNQRLMLRGTYFWNQITRPVANVTLTTTPSLITRQRQNLGSTVSQGVEMELSGQVSNSITLSGGYEYTHATVTSFTVDPALAGLNPSLVGLNVPQIPRHQFDFQARYSRPFILLAVQGRFGGNQFDDDQNTLLLRRYFTLDATASHSLRPGVDVFVAVENLLNRRYDVARTPVLMVGPPILARAGLRLQFGAR